MRVFKLVVKDEAFIKILNLEGKTFFSYLQKRERAIKKLGR